MYTRLHKNDNKTNIHVLYSHVQYVTVYYTYFYIIWVTIILYMCTYVRIHVHMVN